MKNLIALTLLLGGSTLLCAQKPAKTPATYKPVKSEMYRKGWIDFNKNGVKDVYEDPSAPLEARIENLLQQMTLDEKTCQMVTLYGYKRVLKDDLPTPEWKELLWKDGIGAIDEHLNGFQQWGLPPSDNAYVWPASRLGTERGATVLCGRYPSRHPRRLYQRRHTRRGKLPRHQLPHPTGTGTYLEP